MTEVPLRDYVEAQIDALEKRLCAKIYGLETRLKDQHESDEKALRLKAADMDKQTEDIRIEIRRIANIQLTKVGRDEWGEYHTRQLAADFIPRNEFSSYKEKMVAERASALGEVQGKAKVVALVYTTIGVMIAVTSVIVAFFFHR